MAAPALIMASPIEATDSGVAKRSTPPGGYQNGSGKCNGTSCNVSNSLIHNNQPCDHGSCGGRGGGDGKPCGFAKANGEMYCPGSF
ncbi:hypothetical protein N7447_000107 [Penicillium robsamsonii]|uniref:uncharacterized protein n=1 Tax=Penicillium robsamsonii TaxID=1792511 RepID=UPI0025469F2C|nr:uncharacterized protein N7447_000107 [Penicillium robsamsonii]KAJ5834081.1 hypothetical protein N7447_000107 [Penicillium robsamsonii]